MGPVERRLFPGAGAVADFMMWVVEEGPGWAEDVCVRAVRFAEAEEVEEESKEAGSTASDGGGWGC